MPTNNILPFSPTDTGSNLLTQTEYAAASDRTNGNQPGVASSKLNNKALRQSAFVSSQVAQYMADITGANVLDDGDTTKLYGIIRAALTRLPPIETEYLSGSGTHNITYFFFITSGNATIGATYTNNGVTYTVKKTIAGGVLLQTTGNGDPAVSGTLTKASGTGDATLTFHAFRAPLYIEGEAVGGGGGGAGSSTTAVGDGGNGADGGNTTVGGTLVVCNGGVKGAGSGANAGGAGGSATLGTGVDGAATPGSRGGSASQTSTSDDYMPGGNGGISPLGGGSCGGPANGAAPAAAGANSGSGGGGGGSPSAGISGAGGGSGGHAKFLITNVSVAWTSALTYVIGAVGAAGAPGTAGKAAAAGAAGRLRLVEKFQ